MNLPHPLPSHWGPCLCARARNAVLTGALVLLPAAGILGQAPGAPPSNPPAPAPAASDATTPSSDVPSGAPAASPTSPRSAAEPALPAPAPAEAEKAGADATAAASEEEVKKLLVGKTLYLREGYLDNTLSFDEHGGLVGHSPQGSYTLSLVEIEKVHMSKHKVELTGLRYGMHFLGARPDEDPTKAVDKVRITPKKKVLKITIDRELVITPKKKKHPQNAESAPASPPETATAGQPEDADQAKADLENGPQAERPADSASVTTTTSPAHAAKLLRDAIDRIFAQGLDERMVAAMPDLWKLYYQAVANQADYRPTDPAIYRQSAVDQKARLLSTFEPPSNEYAQAGGVAGMALYHAIIGPDGKPQEIVVGRPIGFGLDESAAETIRKASFQPALKDGKPVAVMIDLVVQFRIYSKRTDQLAKPEVEAEAAPAKLPGPYSVIHP